VVTDVDFEEFLTVLEKDNKIMVSGDTVYEI
jgi:hypothetical protein